MSARVPAPKVVRLLNDLFSRFDELAEIYELEKIKTIGDAYMVAAGVPEPRKDHAQASAEMALAMLQVISEFNAQQGVTLAVRIGMHSGPVVAGVIGVKKFIYDLWGDTVNIASRMESSGVPGRIQVTDTTKRLLAADFHFEDRGVQPIKGKGEMHTWLIGRRIGEATMARRALRGQTVAYNVSDLIRDP